LNKFIDALGKDENKGKGDSEIFNSLTKDDGGAFVGTTTDVHIKGNAGMGADVKYSADEIKKMSVDDINKHWSDISASLKDFKK
jgi:hypothetical protein